jgi:hypothetical protein
LNQKFIFMAKFGAVCAWLRQAQPERMGAALAVQAALLAAQ